MKELKFKKIDAFTKGMSSGNPAGYVWMDKEELLSEKDMQQLEFCLVAVQQQK